MSEMIREMRPDEFEQVFAIMERSFPLEEYRTYEEQKQLLRDPRYHIYTVHAAVDQKTENDKDENPDTHKAIQAFLAVWQLETFTFVEHFASDPALRGRGIGKVVLQEAARLFSGRICLEVELPETDLAKRRIAFYERNGFYLNLYSYVQPPLRKGKKELPLMLMTYGSGVSKEKFEIIRDTLYRDVYGQDEVYLTVHKAKDAAVRSFLTDILRQDETLYAKFQLFDGHDSGILDMERYRGRVDAIIRKYAGPKQFISYQEVFSFLQEMEEILEQDVRMMLENGHFTEAFLLTCHLFVSVSAVEMDDSDGTRGMLAEQCVGIWHELERNADSQLQQQMYTWFTGQLESAQSGDLEEYVEQMFWEAFLGKDFLQRKLAFTKRKAQEQKADSDSWSARYYAQKWILYYIGLLEESGCSFAEIASYCKENWEYAEVRKYYAEQCILQKDYDTAEKVLAESLKMETGMSGLVRWFGTRLKEVYRMSGRQEAYKQQLLTMFTKESPGNPDDFRELKSLYSAQEWPQVREEIFRSLPKQARVERLYYEEKLYDRLLTFVLAQKGLFSLVQYEHVLKEEYPQQLLSKYTQELTDMAKRAADRRHYQEWAMHLKRMTQIAGGPQEVQKIVADWRIRYKNRPAMMEELKQF